MSLVYNAVKCLECNKIIESWFRHDYNTCGCPNHAMVDGGLDYSRYGAVDMSKLELLHKYEANTTTEFETVRYLSSDEEDERDTPQEQTGEDGGDESISDDMD